MEKYDGGRSQVNHGEQQMRAIRFHALRTAITFSPGGDAQERRRWGQRPRLAVRDIRVASRDQIGDCYSVNTETTEHDGARIRWEPGQYRENHVLNPHLAMPEESRLPRRSLIPSNAHGDLRLLADTTPPPRPTPRAL